MTQYWNVQYQLVPSNMHQHDSDKRSIRTFKAHVVSILAGFSINFPSCLWDILLPKAELTIKLLRQTSNNPNLSDWAYVNGTFNYVATPFGPLGCRVMIHKNQGCGTHGIFRARKVGLSERHLNITGANR